MMRTRQRRFQISPYLPQSLLREETVARAIELPYWKLSALAALAPRLADPSKEEVFREAFEIASRRDGDDRAHGERLDSVGWMAAMAGLAPGLAKRGHWEEVLSSAQKITVAEWRSACYAAMLPHAPEEHRNEVLAGAFAEACSLPQAYPQQFGRQERAKVLSSLVQYLASLSVANLYPLLNQALRVLASRERKDLLGGTLAVCTEN